MYAISGNVEGKGRSNEMTKINLDDMTLGIVQAMMHKGLEPHEYIMIAAMLLDSSIDTAEEVFSIADLRKKAVDYISDPKDYNAKDKFVLEPFEEKSEEEAA